MTRSIEHRVRVRYDAHHRMTFTETGTQSATFEGKVVIVTGASAGIGQAAAIEYAKAGARVAALRAAMSASSRR